MAFLHTHSRELGIFFVPPTQTSIKHSSFLEYKKTTPVGDNLILELTIPTSNDYDIDLAHTTLHVELNVTPVEAAAANAQVRPVNNFLYRLFNQVDVFFNNKLVTPFSNCYAYHSYIKTLSNYSTPAKESLLTGALFYADDALRMNALPNAAAEKRNYGLVKRQSFISGGQALNMIGYLHYDVFNQDKMLINGVEVRVRLSRVKDKFCLMDAIPNCAFKVIITNTTLIMRWVKVGPGI